MIALEAQGWAQCIRVAQLSRWTSRQKTGLLPKEVFPPFHLKSLKWAEEIHPGLRLQQLSDENHLTQQKQNTQLHFMSDHGLSLYKVNTGSVFSINLGVRGYTDDKWLVSPLPIHCSNVAM